MKLKLLILSGLLYLSSLSYSQTIPPCTFGSLSFTQTGAGLTKTCTANTTLWGSLSYTWKYNGTAVGWGSSQNFTYSTTGPNMICLEVVSIYQDSLRLSWDTCKLTYCDSLTNSTTPPPPPPPGNCIGKSVSFTSSISGTSVTLNATHPGYIGANITWYNGTTNIGSGSSLSTTLLAGTHIICAEAVLVLYDSSRMPYDTCINKYCDTITISTAFLNENETINGLKLFPNPANNNITISYNSTVSTNGNIQVTDLIGKVVLIKEIEFNSNTKSEEKINISNLSKGSYLIKIIGNKNGNYISKPIRFVKQ